MLSQNPESSQGPTPNLQLVISAYSDILDHNRKHTGYGAMFKGMLGGLLENKEVLYIENLKSSAPNSSEELYREIEDKFQEGIIKGDMHAELQDIFHNDTFMRAGIKIAPFGQFGTSTEGNAVTSTELVPIIENTSLFTEFLSNLQPEVVQTADAETFLCDVVANLSKVTNVCFDKRKQEGLSDDEKAAALVAGEDALRTFISIDQEYNRLGLNGAALRERVNSISKELSDFLKSGRGGIVPTELSEEYSQYNNQSKLRIYENMSNCINYWGRNLLPEYLIAQGGQYLTPPNEQAFGPSDWQKDGGQYHWQEAFDFLNQLEKEDRTKPFATEVRRALITSLESVLTELDDQAKDLYWKNQRANLENVLRALNNQPYDENQLTNYIKKLAH